MLDWVPCARVCQFLSVLCIVIRLLLPALAPHSNTLWPTQDAGSESLTLRIVAVFASAAVTVLGLSIFFVKRLASAISPPMLLCFRAGSAGAMISVAV